MGYQCEIGRGAGADHQSIRWHCWTASTPHRSCRWTSAGAGRSPPCRPALPGDLAPGPQGRPGRAARALRRRGMTTVSIDLNSDLGESFGRWTLGDDDALLDVVTSANVACGFHAGDPDILRRAARRRPARGRHRRPGRLPRPGRLRPPVHRHRARRPHRRRDLPDRRAGRPRPRRRHRVRYVKPHGALYNAVVHHGEQAAAVVEAVRLYDAALPVLGPARVGRARPRPTRPGCARSREAFADRAYTPEGTLVSRARAGRGAARPEEVAARMVAWSAPGS